MTADLGRPHVVTDRSPLTYALLFGGFPALGVLAGWLLVVLADWVVTLPWAPMQGPAELIDSLPQPWVTLAAMAVGAVAGVVIGVMAIDDLTTVRVSPSTVEITQGGRTRTVDGPSVSAAFVDQGRLVLLDHATQELARVKTDIPQRRFSDAFTACGYRWVDNGDPHLPEYRRWVEGLPELPTGADALFRARQVALDAGNERDTSELRAELARLGLVVRDDEGRQYWRQVSTAPDTD